MKKSQDLTTLITHKSFLLLCMSFGLISALAAFSRLRDVLLKGLPEVCQCFDDRAVFGSPQKEHDKTLNI